MHYLFDRFRPTERKLIGIAALVLVPVFFIPVLPIWQMKMWAPQYREGLTLTIYANDIKGDLQNINLLNHYVGMKAIAASDFHEFKYLPLALTLFGLMALIGALVNRRWIGILGWQAFTGFAIYMFSDYARWLWEYGHNLDPHAAIKLPLFTPPLIGFKQMANFKVLSLPGPGSILLAVVWLLGPVILFLEWHADRRAARAAAKGRA